MAGKTQSPRGESMLEKRARLSRTKLNLALATETDPRRRFSAAVDYFRSALAVYPDDQAAEKAVLALIKSAERLYARKVEEK